MDEWMNGSSKSLIAGTVCGKYAGSISGTWRYFHDVINDINFNNCSDFHWQTSRRMADGVCRMAYCACSASSSTRKQTKILPTFLFRPLILFGSITDCFGHIAQDYMKIFNDDHENCLIGRMNMNVNTGQESECAYAYEYDWGLGTLAR